MIFFLFSIDVITKTDLLHQGRVRLGLFVTIFMYLRDFLVALTEILKLLIPES